MNPGIGEEAGQTARTLVSALRNEPLSLALITLNLLFLIAFWFIISEISESAARRDSLLSEVAKSCLAR